MSATYPNRLPAAAKVRVCIDGVALQTTAGDLRHGAISLCLHEAWKTFEKEHRERGISGRLSRHDDVHLGRTVDIQFDLY